MLTSDHGPIPKIVPDGHFCSPLVDPKEINERRAELWSPNPPLRGIDYREGEEHELFEKLVPLMKEFPFPAGRPETPGFFLGNDQFGGLDAYVYFGMLRLLKPERLLEMGAGFTTMLAVETRERFLGERPLIVCVEPFPTADRAQALSGKVLFLKEPVWAINPAMVEQLESGDLLFVDCSHVSKTGSDVHTIYFDLFPRLKPGVFIHIHDIFLPFEYPYNWVAEQGRHWNEQYLLLALLTDSKRYEIVFSCAFFSAYHQDAIVQGLGRELAGGSLWLRVASKS
jgi:hypothetical protein